MLAECFDHELEIGDIAKRGRNRRAVEVRAEREMIDTDPLNDIVGMTDEFIQVGIRFAFAVFAQERYAEIETYEAAGIPNGVQLFVSQVAALLAERMNIRVRRDKRSIGDCRYIPETFSFM